MRVAVLLLFVWLTAVAVLAKPTEFIRIAHDRAGKPISMQCAITSYAGPGYTVDLISAVHVGEKSYYQALKQAFKRYDAMLYELIADEDHATEVGKDGSGNDSGLTSLQKGMKKMLGLEFQLEQVDYEAPNFVHADLSPDEFAESMQQHHESTQSMMRRMVQLGMDQSQQTNQAALQEVNPLALLLRRPNDRERMLMRQIMAAGFENLARLTQTLEGPGGSTLITVRNTRALAVLGQQLKLGRKHLAIFYGAAHMPDMERQLLKDFPVKRQGQQRWLVAWDLRPPTP